MRDHDHLYPPATSEMSEKRASLAPETTEAFRASSSRPTPHPNQTKRNATMESTEEQTISGLTIRIKRDRCIASQNCVHVAPEVFVLGND